MIIEKELINWYQYHKRNLPWRNTKDAYKIWISEIILQQTRVEQGLNYYYRFLEQFPTVYELANAHEEDVLKLWQGLGYYSRARNLHFSAKYIVNELDGNFPTTFLALKILKGVGDYTAAAIASFAFNEKVPLVDGNVYRLLSRLYAEVTPIDSSKGKKIFYTLADALLQSEEAEVFNQAIMEFGALQCKPQPDCINCSLKIKCLAYAKGEVNRFPVKSKKLLSKKRYFNYLVIHSGQTTYLQKRNGKDIWQGLFELPLIETGSKMSLAELCKTKDWKNLFGDKELIIDANFAPVIHKLTHQQLHVNFFHIKLSGKENFINGFEDFILVPFNEIEKYPVPKVIENHLYKML